MNIFDFLNTLEMTLNTIEVRGKENLEALYSSLMAIDEYRKSLAAQMKQQINEEIRQPEDGGDELGRQSDIGTESGGERNAE